MSTSVIQERNPLGYESVGRLLKEFSIPAIIANVVGALYNIVDQVFIGHGVGYLGNAATNIAFPLITICLALALMIGIGGAAYYSLSLGRQEPDKAAKAVGTTITGIFVIGVILALAVHHFLEPLLYLFGATPELYPYAHEFTAVSLWGLPFLMLSIGLAAVVRADGSSRYSMMALIVGNIVNCALNPFFIFYLHMGITGSALASVISQLLSAIILLAYIPGLKSLPWRYSYLRPSPRTFLTLMYLGLSSFTFQIASTVVIVVMNNLFTVYGHQTIYGSDIPIAVAGIAFKIYFLFIAITLGIIQGAQPILGFNYGAKNYDRLRHCIRLVAYSSFAVSFAFFFIFQLFPHQIISFFGNGGPLYMEFAVHYVRIYTAAVFLTGPVVTGTIFYTCIGKSMISSSLCVLNQIIFVLPFVIFLPQHMGIFGIAAAQPLANLLTFIAIALSFYYLLKHLPKDEAKVITE